jgi:hypothetical protein
VTDSGEADRPTTADPHLLRLSDAGDAKPAWVTLLTTERYNLQTQRAATTGEANGRASIFLGAVSAGLIALGFQGSASGRSAGTTVFEVLVLSCLSFLGLASFLRCLEVSIDDWQFSGRITKLRAVYAQLVPELAGLLQAAAGAEQAIAMLTARRQHFQMLLSVAGSIGVITAALAGADVGVLVYGLRGPLVAAILVGAGTGLTLIFLSVRFQRARWEGASARGPAPTVTE